MQLSRRTIESTLPQKGFAEDRASHHRYFHHEYDGKRTGIYTYTSHGSAYKTYGDSLLRCMRQQLHLDSIAQLADLVNCPMSREGYNAHLNDKRLLPKPKRATRTVPQPRKTRKAPKRRRRR